MPTTHVIPASQLKVGDHLIGRNMTVAFMERAFGMVTVYDGPPIGTMPCTMYADTTVAVYRVTP